MLSSKPITHVSGFSNVDSVRKMIYNEVGETGLKISKLGLGGATVGFSQTPDEEKEAIQTVIEAIKSGINYIDTAPYYAEGKAETILGKALQQIPREAYYIATKVGRYTLSIPTMFDFSAKRALQSFDESLNRLGLSYVDVIQVHDVEFAPNVDIIVNETLPAVQKIKESGRAKYISITGYPIKKLKEIVELSTVKIDFILSYCRCTLFDNELAEYIPFFKSKNIGVINAACLGMGLLTNNPLPVWHPVKPSIRDVCKNAANYCKKADVDIAKLALHYSFKQPGISTHLVGMATQKTLKDNLNVLINGLNEPELTMLQEIQQKFFHPMTERNWENAEVIKYWAVINQTKEK